MARVTKLLEPYVDQVVLNIPKNQFENNKLTKIGENRYSATVSPFTGYLTSNPSLELLHDFDIYFRAFLDHCQHKFDIIHCHDTYQYPLASYLRKIYGSKIVVTSHLLMTDVLGLYESTNDKWRHQMETEVKAYAEADRVITISEHYKSFLVDKLMVDPNKIDLIYNGVDHSPVMANPKPEPETIGFLGRASLMKGLHLFSRLVETYRDKKFVIISGVSADVQDGYAQEFLDWVELQPNVEFINGLHPDLKWEHMSKCDLAIMPSIREPWGLVSLEWQSAGVPLMASNLDGLKETVTKSNAWPCNPYDLLEEFKKYRFDKERVKNALEFSKKFTWNKCAEEVWGVYKCLLQ